MATLDEFEQEALDALQQAVTRALERKRQLGQYAVFWENGRVIFDGPDAPPEQEPPANRSSIGSRRAAPSEADRPS